MVGPGETQNFLPRWAFHPSLENLWASVWPLLYFTENSLRPISHSGDIDGAPMTCQVGRREWGSEGWRKPSPCPQKEPAVQQKGLVRYLDSPWAAQLSINTLLPCTLTITIMCLIEFKSPVLRQRMCLRTAGMKWTDYKQGSEPISFRWQGPLSTKPRQQKGVF